MYDDSIFAPLNRPPCLPSQHDTYDLKTTQNRGVGGGGSVSLTIF